MTTMETINTGHFEGQRNIEKGTREGTNAILEELLAEAKADITTLETIRSGVAATAQLILAGQPNNTDTLDIGADTYQFLTTPTGATSDIEVEIGADAEGTIDNLVVAINNNGTELLIADKLGTTICRLRSAATVGGTVAAADPSIALDASSMTNGSFDVGDVNMNTLAGEAAGTTLVPSAKLTITTAMITATSVRITFPFTPTKFVFSATASGVPVAFTADTIAIDNGDILLGLGTDLANGNIVTVFASP